jgi:peptide/nickel transport system ATP-binding protein
VMYLGRIVERGTVQEVMRNPLHPYTRALLSAVPRIDGNRGEIIHLGGEMPSPARPPQGCHFHPRCSEVMEVCRSSYPEASKKSAMHIVHCHLYAEKQGI